MKMAVKISHERLSGVLTIQLESFEDERGFFVERYNESRFRSAGLPTSFCQDNHSRSAPGVLRGLHFQADPPQGKLVGVIRGRIWDVVVDIRPTSPTFGSHLVTELAGEDGRLLWIPPGFAHGFCVLGDEAADLLYKADQPYSRSSESGILWSDADLGIKWPVARPVISERDRGLAPFADYCRHPVDW